MKKLAKIVPTKPQLRNKKVICYSILRQESKMICKKEIEILKSIKMNIGSRMKKKCLVYKIRQKENNQKLPLDLTWYRKNI